MKMVNVLKKKKLKKLGVDQCRVNLLVIGALLNLRVVRLQAFCSWGVDK